MPDAAQSSRFAISTRAPAACGALGSYDRGRVRAIAAALGREMCSAHEDERSILFVDREPIRWAGRREHGLGWIDGDVWRGDASTWEESARLGACGLTIEGRRRSVHSSISRLAPLYVSLPPRQRWLVARISLMRPTAQGRVAPVAVAKSAASAISAGAPCRRRAS